MTTIPRNTFSVVTVEQTHETGGLLQPSTVTKKVKPCTRGKSDFHRYSITVKYTVFMKNITRHQTGKKLGKYGPFTRINILTKIVLSKFR